LRTDPFVIGKRNRLIFLFLRDKQNWMLALFQVCRAFLYDISPRRACNVIDKVLNGEVAWSFCLCIGSVGWVVRDGDIIEALLKLRSHEMLFYYTSRSALCTLKNHMNPRGWRMLPVKV